MNIFFLDPERGGRDGEGPGHAEQRDDLQAALGLLRPHPRPPGQAEDRAAGAAPPPAALQTELLAPRRKPGEAQD